MNFRLTSSWKSAGLLLAGMALLLVAAVFALKNRTSSVIPSPSAAPVAATYPGLDLEDPEVTFDVLRYVADTGGDETTRATAILWLDNQSRQGLALSPDHEDWLFRLLENNGHAAWDQEYRFWLFNSAFNALHPGQRHGDLTRQLKRLALHDPERTMRLYAIQHLGVQRSAGNLTGALADEIHTMLGQIAAAPDGQESGAAVRLLAEWDGGETPVNPDVILQALEIAADDSRPVDVRVTALHAAGQDALPLARKLAGETGQHALVRKAAIASIGRHGDEADTAALRDLSAESSRLAQAAKPALLSIRRRAANPGAPAPVPF
jgi:hypothetical protein